MLSGLFEWKNTCFPYKDYSTSNLHEMTESECLSEFRFAKRDIPVINLSLTSSLAWPPQLLSFFEVKTIY